MDETNKLEDVGFLQDIISYIFDEKKIVTYKWISNTLAVHVNRAKQLLYTFIKHVSEERFKELKVTYLVGGILPDNRGCRLQVVSEEDLEKVKAQFKIITSEHIYSVCLKNCLSDLHSLLSVDGVKDSKVGRHGAIQCAKGVSRSAEELASKRQGAHVAADDDKQWPAAQLKQQGKQTSSEKSDKKSSKTGGSISAMFSAQSSKGKMGNNTDSKKEEEKDENTSSSDKKAAETKEVTKSGKPPAGRLAAMFSAQNTKPKTIQKDVQEENKSKNAVKVSAKEISVPQKEVNSEENIDIQEKPSKSKGSKSGSKKSKQKKRKASGSAEEKSKRRKRIVVLDDSDSSSEDDVFGSEEEKSPSPVPVVDDEMEEPVEMANSQEPKSELPEETVINGQHKRKRKLVDKTFQDEEGYVVTKKEYEFVSCSESENEEEKENDKVTGSKSNKKESDKTIDTKSNKKESNKTIDTKSNKKESDKTIDTESNKKETEPLPKEAKGAKKTRKSSPQKKSSPPEKKKQATLMSFFKRN